MESYEYINNKLKKQFYYRLLLLLFSGFMIPISLAPFNVWPLCIISVAWFYLSLIQSTKTCAFFIGWVYGFGIFFGCYSWIFISIKNELSLLCASFITFIFISFLALFFAILSLIWVKYLQNDNYEAPILDSFTFAALWVLLELFRSWFLGGFPWLYIGYNQVNGPLAGWVPIGGVWIASFLMVGTSALLINLFKVKSNNLLLLLLLIFIWSVGIIMYEYPWTIKSGKKLNIAAIQGNIDQKIKWNKENINMQLSLYKNLSIKQLYNNLLKKKDFIDLLIWPETAIPVFHDIVLDYFDKMSVILKNKKAALITGIPIRKNVNGKTIFYNGLIVLGEGHGIYLKQKLVPFGEYIPAFLKKIKLFYIPMSNFTSGPIDQQPIEVKGYKIAPYICYEVVYPEFAAGLAAKSEILLTVSNDAWFGSTIGPMQHSQMAQMRALESGRWMIRATNNGLSSLINNHGKVVNKIPSFKIGILLGTLIPMNGLTPYLKYRIWPLFFISSILIFVSFIKKTKA